MERNQTANRACPPVMKELIADFKAQKGLVVTRDILIR